MKLVKWLLITLIALAFLLWAFIVIKMQPQAVMTTEEVITADEAEQTDRAVKNFKQVIDVFKTDKAHRGAHAKGHACVKAYFNINDDIAPALRHGVFANTNNKFKAWIRFSNGTPRIAPDAENDSRGIAIKLLNVIKPNQTQEFLLHNSPAFFSVNLDDYNQLVESPDKIRYFLPGYNPLNWRIRELSHVIDTLAPPPLSPVWDEYFSNTAYKLGPHNVKYKVSACNEQQPQFEQDQTDPDFLRHTLADELSKDEACLQFHVQLQQTDKLMPVEDPSVLWKESDSPYIPVATIRIPKQQFDTAKQQQFCENLSFSPWNSLDSHKPIGALNRVRKLVYAASAAYRHAFNQTAIPENIDW